MSLEFTFRIDTRPGAGFFSFRLDPREFFKNFERQAEKQAAV
jgi:hypothetical protein